MGEELVTSYQYRTRLYHCLESHDQSLFIADNDL